MHIISLCLILVVFLRDDVIIILLFIGCLIYSTRGDKMKYRILLYGGTGFPFGELTSPNLYQCDLETLEWTVLQIPNNQALPSVYGHVSLLYSVISRILNMFP